MYLAFLIKLFILYTLCLCGFETRSFKIDVENKKFLIENETFQIRGAAIYYWSIPKPYWNNHLKAVRAAGFNTIYTNIEWRIHEPTSGKFNFINEKDVFSFIKLIHKHGFYGIVHLSPGSLIWREFGGLPAWLLWKYSYIYQDDYFQSIKPFFKTILPKLSQHTFNYGGPILAIEIDPQGPIAPQNLIFEIRNYFPEEFLIFQVPHQTWIQPDINYYYYRNFLLYDGMIDSRVALTKEISANPEGSGPYINMHLPGGWMNLWGHLATHIDVNQMLDIIENYMKRNISFVIDQFHEGIHFGFSSGSLRLPKSSTFASFTTNLVYDPILNLVGMPNKKYFYIQRLFQKNGIDTFDLDKQKTLKSYGRVWLSHIGSLLDVRYATQLTGNPENVFSASEPMTFEQMQLSEGFVLYESFIPKTLTRWERILPRFYLIGVHDIAFIFLDGVWVAWFSRTHHGDEHAFRQWRLTGGEKISILVESMGREKDWTIYGENYKGLLGVLVEGHEIKGWTMYPMNFSTPPHRNRNYSSFTSSPGVYLGKFILPKKETPCDTFLNLNLWGKGFAYINGHHLGRYWPIVGPQTTLFVPGCYLKKYPQMNEIILVEMHHNPHKTEVYFEANQREDFVTTFYNKSHIVLILFLGLTLMYYLNLTSNYIYEI